MCRAAPLLLVVWACGTSPGVPDAGDDIGCIDRGNVDAYSVGMSKVSSSGRVKVTLEAADPAPPARGTNTWTVTLTDGNGAALSNAAPSAVPFMPEHGHGSSVTPDMTPSGAPRYQVAPLYFFMPGIWQVTFSATAEAPPADQVVFSFCVAG